MRLAADAVESVATGVFPGLRSGLVGESDGREDLAAYRRGGGYRPIGDVPDLLEVVRRAGLRGRGGAAFPTALKLDAVRGRNGMPIVVANGAEGEPMSVKDRWLMRRRPHLVLDGLRIAAALAGTTETYVYVSDPGSADSIRSALDEAGGSDVRTPRIEVTTVGPAYVAGEETAVVHALNGGEPIPTDKPPRPFEEGVDGRPTVVSNVETLANLPLVHRMGAREYRSAGVDTAAGTFLLTLSGTTGNGLYEVPFGITLRRVLHWLGVEGDGISGLLPGGYFSGVVSASALDTPLDHDSFAAIGSGLGCGAIGVLGPETCPVAVSAGVMTYFADENAGQCGSCFNGSAAMAAILDALGNFQAERSDVERLRHLSGFLRGRGACGTLDGATNVAAGLLREFPDVVEVHLAGRCAVCASGHPPADPWFRPGAEPAGTGESR